ncbi:MAG: metal ABC transporter permease [Candidatus Thermoplasmatota archaeon]|nr:metal ABC transporter permease [Candidatus Thermoplasmatota archaeon]
MGLGTLLLELFIPISELFLPIVPGDVFPYFFGKELGGQPVILFQTSLFAAFLITTTACFFGPYLIVRNLSLIGDGLAHVSFGGIAVAIVMGYSTLALEFALLFSITSAILIYELQSREILVGDTAIAIFLTGMLGLGLVVLQVWGGGITSDIHGYLFGNVLLISNDHLDKIASICVISFILLMIIRRGLLAMTLDPLAARVQGIPVHVIGLLFSIITAAIVVGMVKMVGVVLVTALLVTPAATARLVGGSFRSSLIWSQIFGFTSVLLGLYFSSEMGTGTGTMIALVAAIVFAIVLISQNLFNFFRSSDNY